MLSKEKITDLLRRHEELANQGQSITIEELCDHEPELVAALRSKLTPALPATELYNTPDPKPNQGLESLYPRLTDLPPGYTLVPPRLGQGGCGQVWKALGPGGYHVAMKFLNLGHRASAKELQALQIIKEVRHANLVTIFGSWITEEYLIIAMELANDTLAGRLKHYRNLGHSGIPRDELLRYMADTAKAIDYLNSPRHDLSGHTRVRACHRDIKPQNLLLFGESVKVGDFGLVRVLEEASASHSGQMTWEYAAPEFFEGRTDFRSDQYSLAVTYCQLRGGRLPFSGNYGQMMHGHLSGIPDLSMLPAEERPVIERALSKKPEHRWDSCQEMVEALHSVAAGKAVLFPGGVPIRGMLAQFEGPTRNIYAVDFTPDGQLAITGGAGREVVVWSVTHGRPTKQLVGHGDTIRDLVVDSSGAGVITTGDDGTVRFWDLTTGTVRHKSALNLGKLYSLSMGPNDWLLSGSISGKVRLWNTRTKETRNLRGHVGEALTAALSPDGRFAVVAGGGHAVRNFGPRLGMVMDSGIRVWDIARPSEPPIVLIGHSGRVLSVAFTPDSRLLLSGGEDGTLRAWDVDAQVCVQSFTGHTGPIHAIRACPDQLRAVSVGADGTLRLWRLPMPEVSNPRELDCFRGHDGPIRAVAVSSDGRHVLSAGQDATLRLWRLPAS